MRTCVDDRDVGVEWHEGGLLCEVVERGDEEQGQLVDRILQLRESVLGQGMQCDSTRQDRGV